MYVCMYVSIYLCMYVCIYLCMYVSMYVCMYVFAYLQNDIHHFTGSFHSDPLPLPSLSLSAEEQEAELATIKARLTKVSTEYQNYKIKAEIALRQRDLHHRSYTRTIDSSPRQTQLQTTSSSSLYPQDQAPYEHDEVIPTTPRQYHGFVSNSDSFQEDPHQTKLSEELTSLQERVSVLSEENDVLRRKHGDSILGFIFI